MSLNYQNGDRSFDRFPEVIKLLNGRMAFIEMAVGASLARDWDLATERLKEIRPEEIEEIVGYLRIDHEGTGREPSWTALHPEAEWEDLRKYFCQYWTNSTMYNKKEWKERMARRKAA